MTRPDGRPDQRAAPDHLRARLTEMAAGSVLVTFGRTKVLCTRERRRGRAAGGCRARGKGWGDRRVLDAAGLVARARRPRGRQGQAVGRTGRDPAAHRPLAARPACDMAALGERQLIVDCDVLQADGGTRTASICGGYLALHDAITRLVAEQGDRQGPSAALRAARRSASGWSAARRCSTCLRRGLQGRRGHERRDAVTGRRRGEPRFVEVQGTAEGGAFSRSELDSLLDLAGGGLERAVRPAGRADRTASAAAPDRTVTRW